MVKKRNLTQEKIFDATKQLATVIGIRNITFPKLAEALDIKYPSLYNHFKNMAELKLRLTETLIDELTAILHEKLAGLHGAEAIKMFSDVYLDFAFANASVYELLINVPQTHSTSIIEKNIALNQQIQTILINDYQLESVDVFNKSRMLRSILHGYISLRFKGYFKSTDVSAEESYQAMLADYIFLLNRAKKTDA